MIYRFKTTAILGATIGTIAFIISCSREVKYVGPKNIPVGSVVKIKIDGRKGVLIKYGLSEYKDGASDGEHKVLVRIEKPKESIGFGGGYSRYTTQDFYVEELEIWKENK